MPDLLSGYGGAMMKWRLFAAGSCRHLEAVAVRGGAWRQVAFPALCAALETPAGWLVVDTGYAPRVREACRSGWWRLYPWLLPVEVTAEEGIAHQFKLWAGPEPPRMAGIFLTHFHVDHEGGLRDFPAVPVYATREAWEAARSQRGFASLRAAHLPALLPEDFANRVKLLDFSPSGAPEWVPAGWDHGVDVLGDGALWAVPLPGHAVGQAGLMFRDDSGRLVFLVADALWRVDWLQPNQGPRWPVRLVSHDWKALHRTIARLRELARTHPGIRIIPFHCDATAREQGVFPIHSALPDSK